MALRDSLRQQFDRICDTLERYQLKFAGDVDTIRIEREKAFDVCLPILEEISRSWNPNVDLSSSIHKLLSMLSIDQSSKRTLDEVFDLIVVEFGEQQKLINVLQNRIDRFEEKFSLDKLKTEAHELVCLFKFYFVDKSIRKHYTSQKLYNWSTLTDEWSKREMIVIAKLGLERSEALDDRVQKDPLIFNLVSPIEEDLQKQTNSTIKLIDLRRISNDRHELAHHVCRSVADQRALIAKCPEENVPCNYVYCNELKQIIKSIRLLDTNPTKTSLRSVR